MLSVVTNRKRTPPPETGMIDLTPYEDNEKSNFSSDTNYSNSNKHYLVRNESSPTYNRN